MKKFIGVTLALCLAFSLSLAACGSSDSGSDYSGTATAVTDTSITAEETTTDFSITTEDGTVTNSGSIYTISSSGTYSVTGGLTGQILVNNTDSNDTDDIIIELNGTTVKYSEDSPIKIVSKINDVEISAKKNTENVVKDLRSAKTVDNENLGEGAISSKADLKLKGTGTLVVTGNYNNGIHTTKDLKIQKLSLKVTAYNNAIKGKNSVTISSGTIVAISTNGDGVKTEDTETDKGNITVNGGSITVYAAGDGFQAARDFSMETGTDDDGNTTSPTVTVYTGSYSGYTASGATTTSYKGVKVQNELNISAGTITLKTYDDGLHADYGTSFTDGTSGKGTIIISGGTVNMNVYSPENKTSQGRQGPSGWGNQQTVSGADGIHADNTVNISGGEISIDSAYEGLEANHILISGGKTYVAGNDDGINASKKINQTPTIVVSGGYLDVTVSPSGDTDGIDSNGTYTQTGGVVITRGPSSEMAAAIDADSSVTVSGGTLIVLGYGNVKTGGSSVKTYSLSLHSSGNHTVKIDGTSYTFNNAYSYGKTTVYSSVTVSA
ncbi:MAG: carbohydrate-binding domain-containing protein [Clostridia bacterium]|nr:carbohydrate-binding domain-containing protein [Clostridia bacterium]